MIKNNLILENEKVILRPMSIDDMSVLEEIAFDKSIWDFFIYDIVDKESLRQFVSDALKERDLGLRIPFTIVDKRTAKVAGSTSYGNLSMKDRRVEIGWTWLGKGFQGTGLNRQCKFLLLQFAFEAAGFERVEFKTDALNVIARRALEKLGARQEGILRSHTQMPRNRRRDTVYYSILSSEWKGIKETFFCDLY